MPWSAIGAFGLGLAVILGAFGAHGLRDRLDAYSLGVYERAVFYQFVHALGLLTMPLFLKAGMIAESSANRAAWLLLIGIVVFSGSLYALAISGIRALGAITPIGGLAFIGGWLLLGFGLLRSR
ncbi:MAG TPA: DUF423 domain-containing protein [Bryobacteraceae bacterium]|nr:DUF423 domain-containing protein [Bryobacteraceae bacterium]